MKRVRGPEPIKQTLEVGIHKILSNDGSAKRTTEEGNVAETSKLNTKGCPGRKRTTSGKVEGANENQKDKAKRRQDGLLRAALSVLNRRFYWNGLAGDYESGIGKKESATYKSKSNKEQTQFSEPTTMRLALLSGPKAASMTAKYEKNQKEPETRTSRHRAAVGGEEGLRVKRKKGGKPEGDTPLKPRKEGPFGKSDADKNK